MGTKTDFATNAVFIRYKGMDFPLREVGPAEAARLEANGEIVLLFNYMGYTYYHIPPAMMKADTSVRQNYR